MNVTAMAMDSTAFMLAFLISRGIAAFALGSAAHIGTDGRQSGLPRRERALPGIGQPRRLPTAEERGVGGQHTALREHEEARILILRAKRSILTI